MVNDADLRPVELHFEHGTLVAPLLPPSVDAVATGFVFDDRTGVHRAPAWRYREVALHLHRSRIPYVDKAKAFEPLALQLREAIAPFPYQQAALDAWLIEKRGVVVLPTGAGKTMLAILALSRVNRPALVVVPTLSLMYQWRKELLRFFDTPVGLIGGGHHDREQITVTTYDSAALHTEFHGNRFGLLIFDECHHLPSPTNRFIAEGSIAPFRLGLTATLERTDGGEKIIFDLVGPVCHSVGIEVLEGKYLADYTVERLEVPLEEEEETRYQAMRDLYVSFLRSERISMGTPDGWRQFIMRSQRTAEGRAAFAAYREQRRIALTSRSKLQALWEILLRHRHDRVIVFTEDNETVYKLSRWLLAPAITHHTTGPERLAILESFARGDWPILLTSKVLNEGVDVPEANVGVILSGSGSVREHVQRLGRILRRRPEKRATLYEICSAGTAESGISERRRQHRAYQRPAAVPDPQRTGDPHIPVAQQSRGSDLLRVADDAGGERDRH
jgi:superfamily II DNA or RNA helicase